MSICVCVLLHHVHHRLQAVGHHAVHVVHAAGTVHAVHAIHAKHAVHVVQWPSALPQRDSHIIGLREC